MSLFACTLACLLFSMRYGHCNSNRMICEDTENEETDTEISVETSGCRPGIQGIKRDHGISGLPGPPGKVEYERLEEIIEARVAEETRDLRMRIEKMSVMIQNLTLKTPVTCEGVAYNGRCFWADVHSDRDVTVYDASEICKRKNHELANIYSKSQYNAIMGYLQSKVEQRNYIQVWTGMKKTYKELAAHMSNGALSHFARPRFPGDHWYKNSPRKTHVYIQFQTGDSGMDAIWPSFTLHGPLCQYYIY